MKHNAGVVHLIRGHAGGSRYFPRGGFEVLAALCGLRYSGKGSKRGPTGIPFTSRRAPAYTVCLAALANLGTNVVAFVVLTSPCLLPELCSHNCTSCPISLLVDGWAEPPEDRHERKPRSILHKGV